MRLPSGIDDVIDLRFDALPAVLLERGHVDLVVEVPDVADDRLILHAPHVIVRDHVQVAGRRDEDVGLVAGVLHGHDAEAFHRRLQCANRVNLGHPYLGRERAQRLGAALADIAVAADHRDLARDHDVGRALDAIDQRFTATIQIVELRLRHRIIDVDGGEGEHAVARHLVEPLDAGRSLLGHAADRSQPRRIPLRITLERVADGVEQGGFLLARGLGD